MKIDVYHNAVEKIRNVAWVLEDLAGAMEETGQTFMSKKLLRMSETLKQQAAAIFEQVGDDVGEMVNNAEKNSAAILRAVLAGSALATDDKETKKKLAKAVLDMSPE